VSEIIRRARSGTILHVGVSSNQELAAALLSQNPQIDNVAANNGCLHVSIREGVEDYSFVPHLLISNGFRLTLLREEEVNLETAFMRLTKGMVQ
jgi:ABC-2 type transport system ATP-binding protein